MPAAGLLRLVPGARPSLGAMAACAWAFVAWLGFLPPAAVGVILGVAVVAGCLQLLRTRPVAPKAPLPWMLGLIGIAIHGALVFTVPVNYDFLSYHLPLAERYPAAFSGDWVNFYAGMPLAVPAIQRHGAFAGWAAVAAMNALPILAAASCIAAIARRLGARPMAQALAATLWLVHPLVTDASRQHLSDGWPALFGLAAFEAALLAAARPRARGMAAVSGFLGASAVAAKLGAAGIVLAPMLMVLAGLLVEQRGWRAALAPLAMAVGAVAVTLAPWALRAATLRPDRLPALVTWTHAQQRFVVAAHQPQRPWQAAYWHTAARKLPRLVPTLAPGGNAPALRFGSALGLLAIAVVGAVKAPRRRGLALLVAATLGLAAWLLLRDNPDRFALPAGGLLLALASAAYPRGGARDAAPPARLALLLGGALLVLVLLINTVDALFKAATSPRVMRRADLRAALAETLGPPYVEAIGRATALAGDGRLLVLFDARTALFPSTAEVTTVWDSWRWIRDGDIGEALAREGFTALFVNEFEFGRLLQFYARDRLPHDPWRVAGLSSRHFREELRAFPPATHLDEAQQARLAEWLRERRAASPLPWRGGDSEIWLAPIPTSASTLTTP